MIELCSNCKGAKLVLDGSGMRINCQFCDGAGHIKHTEQEQSDTSEISFNSGLPKKRGRPPRIK